MGCRYVPGAVVEHFYSRSAGRATPLKAYYIERNRPLLPCFKNFPTRLLWRVPFASALRYFWHVIAILAGKGKGAEFRRSGYSHHIAFRSWCCAHTPAAFFRYPTCSPSGAVSEPRAISTRTNSFVLSRSTRSPSVGWLGL